MQLEMNTIITIVTLLIAVVAHFVRNETNQKQIIKRLDQLNGRVYENEKELHEHIKEYHSKK